MDIKHSTGEFAITSIKGYFWFMCLNIIFSIWLLGRIFQGESSQPAVGHSTFILYSVILFSLLNVVITLRLKHRINEGWYQRCLPGIVLLFGVMWAVVFFSLLADFSQPLLVIVLAVIILLPATITFYLSLKLLLLFAIPIILSLIYAEVVATVKFTLLQSIATFIVLVVVLSARYILLESYLQTQRSEYEKGVLIKKLLRLANYDTLTGLYNRHSLNDTFAQRTRQLKTPRQSLFLIVLDIDFFKQYNDIYGHVEGDKCLIQVSRCLEQSLRKTSDAAFRLGGEEFVVLAVCESVNQAMAIAKRIRYTLAQAHIRHEGSTVSGQVTFSQGIARWQHDMSLEVLLELADKALYQAKREGRDRIRVLPDS